MKYIFNSLDSILNKRDENIITEADNVLPECCPIKLASKSIFFAVFIFTTISILSILALERQHAVAKYILRASTLVPLGLEASFQFLDDLATVLFTVVALAALCCKLVVLHNPACVFACASETAAGKK